jgi:ribonuclease R
MLAERDTTDRYLAAFLADRVGAEFPGRISGVQRFGLFVKLDETGADGLVPIRSVGREYFHFDPDTQTLKGADTGTTIGIGQRVLVRLADADPVTGGLMLDLLQIEGASLPAGRPPRKGGFSRAPGRGKTHARLVRKKRERKQ